jgi:hypothetical protein
MWFKFNPKQYIQQIGIYQKPLLGDWFVIIASLILIYFLFQTFWQFEAASLLKVRQGNHVVGTFDLNQDKIIHLHGAIGESIIRIQYGKVRFKQSPCNNQYCVHQGWLSHAGQVAICLPNQISLQLIGKHQQPYDSLNY